MTPDELLAVPFETPPAVLLKDGQLGLLLIYPHRSKKECGVQVPGEQYHRWIDPAELSRTGDALIQEGAPSLEEVAKRFEAPRK